MSQFYKFADAVAAQVNKMHGLPWFRVDVLDLNATYLAAFPDGTNPIFRTNTEHDCNTDRHWLRRMGTVVALREDGTRMTCFDDLGDLPEPYATVAKALRETVRQAPITRAFFTAENQFGQKTSPDSHSDIVWNHFYSRTCRRVISPQPDTAAGTQTAAHQVFSRGLRELTQDALDTVAALIDEDRIYRGAEHRPALNAFLELRRAWQKSPSPDDFAWANAHKPGARFRNAVIGTLVVDLSSGKDLEEAVRMFESKVAPHNYKRSKALITPKMVEQATAKLEALGLLGAIRRRHATVEDVSVNDVLFVDNSVAPSMKDSMLDSLMAEAKRQGGSTDPDKLAQRATPMKVQDFLDNVVPKAKGIELLVENKMLGNFASITAPEDSDTGRLFRWGNDFAWSYDGDVADSLREKVAAAGGRVDGPFRFTHEWNHEGRRNASLMDLHVLMPGCPKPTQGRQDAPNGRGRGRSQRVGWDARNHSATGASQDVDYTNAAPAGHVPVENIAFPRKDRMPEGTYECYVHNWTLRSPNSGGFKAQIEIDGQIFDYDYPKPVGRYEWIHVASVTLKNGVFSIEHRLPSSATSQNKWGIDTQQLVPVDVLLRSPNHWEGAGTGNLHWFFILRGCQNPNPVRGIYNEYLRPDLDEHRKVFEVLGSKTKCPFSEKQLSGLGFSSTKRDEALVVVDGKRAFQLQF